MSENIKDIIEILELAKEEIENNDENITATLDLQDLKSLKNLLDLYQKEKQKNKELEDKIKARIEELNTKRINFENDNANKIFMREFIRKYTEKDTENFETFNIPEVIAYMTNNEYIARISELQELLAPKLLKERN